ncbi:MAG: discoidin domain-containing protein [Phycisphaerae bacterium]|nr:discoidin domain-containing protein [Phycisphaerae bacterium]
MLNRKITTVLTGLVCVVVVALGGCDPQFDLNRGNIFGTDAISSQLTWKIQSQHGFKDAKKSIDGNSNSYAITRGKNYRGASLTIDLERQCVFNMVVIIHGAREFDFAKEVQLSISSDGKNFKPCYQTFGTRKITYLPVLTPVTARYIRLTAIEPGAKPWAIAEIYLQ